MRSPGNAVRSSPGARRYAGFLGPPAPSRVNVSKSNIPPESNAASIFVIQFLRPPLQHIECDPRAVYRRHWLVPRGKQQSVPARPASQIQRRTLGQQRKQFPNETSRLRWRFFRRSLMLRIPFR